MTMIIFLNSSGELEKYDICPDVHRGGRPYPPALRTEVLVHTMYHSCPPPPADAWENVCLSPRKEPFDPSVRSAPRKIIISLPVVSSLFVLDVGWPQSSNPQQNRNTYCDVHGQTGVVTEKGTEKGSARSSERNRILHISYIHSYFLKF